MIINGTIIQNVDPEETELVEVLTQFIEDEQLSQECENEALGLLDFKMMVGKLDGDNDDFVIEFKIGGKREKEYRFIHEDVIQDKFMTEAEEVFDVEVWKEAVSNGNTEEGYNDWFNNIVDHAEYGEVFSSYDGGYQEINKYIIFRVN